MKAYKLRTLFKTLSQLWILFVLLAAVSVWPYHRSRIADTAEVPTPLIADGHPVDWWFVFKFNSAAFSGCGGGATRSCIFGGQVQPYKAFGQQFAYASSADPTLKQGSGCIGDSTTDPLGATFSHIYKGNLFYVLLNDQFYGHPLKNELKPWGHSKGMMAWNSDGNGLVLQVSTPSWPGSGSSENQREDDGNTLGCVLDNDVLVSQHFFALKLDKDDVVMVLKALANASVVTDPTNPQIVKNGGPPDIQALVRGLGKQSTSKTATGSKLSDGVELISKPSALHVPPWQMVSAILGGVPLRAATWWASPKIYTTTPSTTIGCWSTSLGNPGPIEIATTGHWGGKEIGFTGVALPNGNHAKVGVSPSGNDHLSIFGDMNQQGILSGSNCASSQNGRGGLFYVIDNPDLSTSLTNVNVLRNVT